MELQYERLQGAVDRFYQWLETNGQTSHDLMDFYGSKLGIFIKHIYYKNKYLGLPLAAAALIQDAFFPRMVALYRRKGREAIGDAHYAMAMMNLFELTGEEKYMKLTRQFLDALIKSSCKGYSGHCWGYTYDWQNTECIYPVGTPFITVTPYGFWAFMQHYRLTGDTQSRDIARSVADFAANDLLKHHTPNGTICTSYSPLDSRFVINANTYRAAMLAMAWKEFGEEKYLREADLNIEFVLSYQEPDGSWYYEAVGTRDRFIDNFHTCFVLRNLMYYYKENPRKDVLEAIQKGYAFYRKHLFRSDNTPIHFAVQKHNKLRKYEMYDYAEGILLGCLLDDIIPGAFEFSNILANDLITRFQLKDGHFLTRVNSLGMKHKVAYHRWPQSQLVCSLTHMMKKMKGIGI
jgi:hypothetical protein